MDKETIEKYKQAGKIAAQVLEYGKGLIVKDASLLDVTEKIEDKIFEGVEYNPFEGDEGYPGYRYIVFER